jgi:hypothetical protein
MKVMQRIRMQNPTIIYQSNWSPSKIFFVNLLHNPNDQILNEMIGYIPSIVPIQSMELEQEHKESSSPSVLKRKRNEDDPFSFLSDMRLSITRKHKKSPSPSQSSSPIPSPIPVPKPERDDPFSFLSDMRLSTTRRHKTKSPVQTTDFRSTLHNSLTSELKYDPEFKMLLTPDRLSPSHFLKKQLLDPNVLNILNISADLLRFNGWEHIQNGIDAMKVNACGAFQESIMGFYNEFFGLCMIFLLQKTHELDLPPCYFLLFSNQNWMTYTNNTYQKTEKLKQCEVSSVQRLATILIKSYTTDKRPVAVHISLGNSEVNDQNRTCHHAVAALYVEKTETEWVRYYIDTSTLGEVDCDFYIMPCMAKSEEIFKEHVERKTGKQVHISHNKNCVVNIQSIFGLCSSTSFGMLIHLLKNVRHIQKSTDYSKTLCQDWAKYYIIIISNHMLPNIDPMDMKEFKRLKDQSKYDQLEALAPKFLTSQGVELFKQYHSYLREMFGEFNMLLATIIGHVTSRHLPSDWSPDSSLKFIEEVVNDLVTKDYFVTPALLIKLKKSIDKLWDPQQIPREVLEQPIQKNRLASFMAELIKM